MTDEPISLSLNAAYIDDIRFVNLAKDLTLDLVWPDHDWQRRELKFTETLHFSTDKDGDDEARFTIVDCKIEVVEEGNELLKSLGGFRYKEPIGRVVYCEIEGDATMRVVCRDYQLA